MGQSLVMNYLHIVFSTKHRVHMIDFEIESELHAYLGSICSNLDSPALMVGGYTDHIHILCRLSKMMLIPKLLEEIKANSSKWIKTRGSKYESFYWQDGYGAFSVSPRGVDRVITYIKNQHKHHGKVTFQGEYLGMLKEYKIEYDERYVWD